jgi:hypothetical protein
MTLERAMKRSEPGLVFASLVIGIMLLAIPAAAQGPPAAPPQEPQTAAPAGPTDERQARYVTEYRDIHDGLRHEHDRLLANSKDQTVEWKRQQTEMRSRARRTGAFRSTTIRLKTEQEDIQSKIKQLEGKRDALRTDAAAQHGGEIPRLVAEKWAEVDAEYAAFLKRHTEQVDQDLAERQPVVPRYPRKR